MPLTSITNRWSPVISVLLQRDTKTGLFALLVFSADESQAGSYDIDSVTMRAAQLEATGWVKAQGWEPTARWSEGDDDNEALRIFKRTSK